MDAPGVVGAPWWAGVRAVVRVVTPIVGLVALYYLVPMDRRDHVSGVALVVGALIVSTVLGALQVVSIIRAARPWLRAVEVLAFSIPFLVLSFATGYFVLSQDDPAAFTEELTRTDALYFATTVFATVGFGDITPASPTARLVVTGQMVLDLLVLGVGLRVVVGAVQLGRERRTAPPA